MWRSLKTPLILNTFPILEGDDVFLINEKSNLNQMSVLFMDSIKKIEKKEVWSCCSWVLQIFFWLS